MGQPTPRPRLRRVFIDVIMVKVRDGQAASRPIYAAIGVSLAGERAVLGRWAGTGGEDAKFWLSVLTDLKNRGVADVSPGSTDTLYPLSKEGVGSVSPLVAALTMAVLDALEHPPSGRRVDA